MEEANTDLDNVWITIVTILFALSLISERITNLIKLNIKFFQRPNSPKEENSDYSEENVDSSIEQNHERKILWLAVGSGIFVAVLSGADLFTLVNDGELISFEDFAFKHIVGFVLSGFFISLGFKFWHDVLKIVLSFPRLQKYRSRVEK